MIPTAITRLDVTSVAEAVAYVVNALEHDAGGQALVVAATPAPDELGPDLVNRITEVDRARSTITLASGARLRFRRVDSLEDAYKLAGLEVTILVVPADLEPDAVEYLEHRLRRSGPDAYRGGLTVVTIR